MWRFFFFSLTPMAHSQCSIPFEFNSRVIPAAPCFPLVLNFNEFRPLTRFRIIQSNYKSNCLPTPDYTNRFTASMISKLSIYQAYFKMYPLNADWFSVYPVNTDSFGANNGAFFVWLLPRLPSQYRTVSSLNWFQLSGLASMICCLPCDCRSVFNLPLVLHSFVWWPNWVDLFRTYSH